MIYTRLHDKQLLDPQKDREATTTKQFEQTQTQKTKSSLNKREETGVKTTSITESGIGSLTVSAQTGINAPQKTPNKLKEMLNTSPMKTAEAANVIIED